MRLFHGGAPGASSADMWRALRDTPIDPCRPYTEQVAVANARADYQPLSKGALRRLRKREAEPSVTPVDPPRPERTLPDSVAFIRDQRVLLGRLGVLRQPDTPRPRVIDRPHAPHAEQPIVVKPLCPEQRALRKEQLGREYTRLRAVQRNRPGDAVVNVMCDRAWEAYANA